MSSLLKKQAESWAVLKRQVDKFIKKANLEVAVVVTFYDKISKSRKCITHEVATNHCGVRLHENNYSTENAPAWWPAQVPYSNPCKRPKHVSGWTDLLRIATRACYEYYGKQHLTGENLETAHPPSLTESYPEEQQQSSSVPHGDNVEEEEQPHSLPPSPTEDYTEEPQQSSTVPHDSLPDEALSPLLAVPALQQILQHYSTLNQTDLDFLNIQSTPEAIPTAPPSISMSMIAPVEDDTINTDASLTFDQHPLQHSPQPQPQPQPAPSSHNQSQPESSQSSEPTIISQPSPQRVRRSQRQPKRTLKGQDYNVRQTRQRR
ncbi:pinin-like [Ptychodera flava]|uniref:pinin-like n=1 Tax=Ptychodera flava TaxID=63121 RepID=UPI00396AABA8